MGLKQIPVTKFVKYLESLGLINIRTTSSHDYFNFPKGHPKGSLQRPTGTPKVWRLQRL